MKISKDTTTTTNVIITDDADVTIAIFTPGAYCIVAAASDLVKICGAGFGSFDLPLASVTSVGGDAFDSEEDTAADLVDALSPMFDFVTVPAPGG